MRFCCQRELRRQRLQLSPTLHEPWPYLACMITAPDRCLCPARLTRRRSSRSRCLALSPPRVFVFSERGRILVARTWTRRACSSCRSNGYRGGRRAGSFPNDYSRRFPLSGVSKFSCLCDRSAIPGAVLCFVESRGMSMVALFILDVSLSYLKANLIGRI